MDIKKTTIYQNMDQYIFLEIYDHFKPDQVRFYAITFFGNNSIVMDSQIMDEENMIDLFMVIFYILNYWVVRTNQKQEKCIDLANRHLMSENECLEQMKKYYKTDRKYAKTQILDLINIEIPDTCDLTDTVFYKMEIDKLTENANACAEFIYKYCWHITNI